jgi:hypothetical protein
MWRLILKLISAVSFVAGIVGWITLPDDAPLWPKRLGPVFSAMTKDDLVMVLFGLSAIGFLTAFVAPALRPGLQRAGALVARAKTTWAALARTTVAHNAPDKLELVYRVGEPFLEYSQELGPRQKGILQSS